MKSPWIHAARVLDMSPEQIQDFCLCAEEAMYLLHGDDGGSGTFLRIRQMFLRCEFAVEGLQW